MPHQFGWGTQHRYHMNNSWLQQMQTDSLLGAEVIILACGHSDVKAGQTGRVSGTMPGGYAVDVFGKFAKDVQATQWEERTETVFVEANMLQRKADTNEQQQQ